MSTHADINGLGFFKDELENAARAADGAAALQGIQEVEQIRKLHLSRIVHDELQQGDEVVVSRKRVHVENDGLSMIARYLYP